MPQTSRVRVTENEFRIALEQIKPNIRDHELRFLEGHFRAPQHTASAQDLAISAGYKDFNVTNLLYSQFAHKLWIALGRPTLSWDKPSSILASFTATEPIRWIMHPELASAVRDLGWFKGSQKTL